MTRSILFEQVWKANNRKKFQTFTEVESCIGGLMKFIKASNSSTIQLSQNEIQTT